MEKISRTSKYIVEHITENKLSVHQIAMDTGVAEHKLMNKSKPLSSEEFLEVCSYLNLRPEDM